MHIDLIELFRCPRPHEESWLVASFDRMSERHVVEGRLGCPVCRAEFPIERGVLRFDRMKEAAGGPAAPDGAPVASMAGADSTRPDGAGEDESLRLAALLGLMDAGGVVILSGSWGRYAARIAPMTEDIHLVLHDPDTPPVAGDSGRVSAIISPGRLPVAAGSLRGVALDSVAAGLALMEGAVRALRPKGRLVVPAGAELPEGVAELASDESVRVAERRETPRLLSLGRGGRRQGQA